MRTATSNLACMVAACLLGGAILLLPTALAYANPIIPWDHYKTYKLGEPLTVQFPIVLEDQFGVTTHVASPLEQLGVPASKNGEPISDSTLHYTWWSIRSAEPARRVMVNNQFGEQVLDLWDSHSLWNPALKDPVPGQTLPVANHYKCYNAYGLPVGREVTLETQFGTETVTVMQPEVFCNPAGKTDPSGHQFPVVDSLQHYVCYRLEPTHTLGRQVSVMDQFVFEPLYLVHSRYLCVPTFKTGVVATAPSTWGRLKALYR